MQFCFYPNHEYGCPHVGHCPHLGGAALGIVVSAASEHDESLRMLHGQLEREREATAKLVEENERLKQQVEELKRELNLERQNKFATNQPKAASAEEEGSDPTPRPPGKKRGAPQGHPGWFRPTPTHYDELVHVDAPCRCPHCGSHAISVYQSAEPADHLQEDMSRASTM